MDVFCKSFFLSSILGYKPTLPKLNTKLSHRLSLSACQKLLKQKGEKMRAAQSPHFCHAETPGWLPLLFQAPFSFLPLVLLFLADVQFLS